MRIIGLPKSAAAGIVTAACVLASCSPSGKPTVEAQAEPAGAPAAEAGGETVQGAAAVESEPAAAPEPNSPPSAPEIHQAAAPPTTAPAPASVRRDPAMPLPAPAPAPTPARPIVQASVGLPSGAGRELTQRTCTGCHGVDAITAQGRTPDGWAQIINQMQNMGLSASEEDLVQIHAYLSRNLPPR